MGKITYEQHITACSVDLAAWLLKHHPDDVTIKYGSVVLRTNDHISVKPGYHGYMDFRTGAKGNNISYLREYLGYGYRDAVLALLEETTFSGTPEITNKQNVVLPDQSTSVSFKAGNFVLPEKATTEKHVTAYLHSRGISYGTICMLINAGLVYESRTGKNAVFVTPEHDYYEARGTNTYAERRCRRRTECSNYAVEYGALCKHSTQCECFKAEKYRRCQSNKKDRFWYLVSAIPVKWIFVCEGAIDAISLYELYRLSGTSLPAAYISIGGSANQSKIDRIKRQHPGVVIATDNDFAGDACRSRNVDCYTIRPQHKDWNDDLKAHITTV